MDQPTTDQTKQLRFFRSHKADISCMDDPLTFLRKLRDNELIPEDRYQVSHCSSSGFYWNKACWRLHETKIFVYTVTKGSLNLTHLISPLSFENNVAASFIISVKVLPDLIVARTARSARHGGAGRSTAPVTRSAQGSIHPACCPSPRTTKRPVFPGLVLFLRSVRLGGVIKVLAAIWKQLS